MRKRGMFLAVGMLAAVMLNGCGQANGQTMEATETTVLSQSEEEKTESGQEE